MSLEYLSPSTLVISWQTFVHPMFLKPQRNQWPSRPFYFVFLKPRFFIVACFFPFFQIARQATGVITVMLDGSRTDGAFRNDRYFTKICFSLSWKTPLKKFVLSCVWLLGCVHFKKKTVCSFLISLVYLFYFERKSVSVKACRKTPFKKIVFSCVFACYFVFNLKSQSSSFSIFNFQ